MSAGRFRTIWLGLIVSSGLLAGCGGEQRLKLEALEHLPEEEDTAEFFLGEFDVPVPEHIVEADGTRPPRNYLQLEFSLFAEIVPEATPQLAASFERHEGVFRDCVIQVFRNATLEELEEPSLVTIKARLIDAIEPILGAKLVRRLIIPSLQKYEL